MGTIVWWSLFLMLKLTVVNGKIQHGNGTFLINGIFPITNENEELNPQLGIMYSEAMKWAIQEVNKNRSYLHGYQFDVNKIYDSIKEEQVQKNVLDTFMEKIPFLVGPYSSDTSYTSSILTKTFQDINGISYSATFSDFDMMNSDEERMLRTVPSDRFRVDAVLALIKDLRWNFVSVVSSYGYNGEREALHLTSKISSVGACLAAQIDLAKSPTNEDYQKTIDNLRLDSRLKVVVLFTSGKDTRNFMAMLKKLNLANRFNLICAYGCTNYINVIEGNELVAEGALSLDVKLPDTSKFTEYFLNKKPTANSLEPFNIYWERLFDCSLNQTNMRKYLKMCTMKESLKLGSGYYINTPVHTVINAVFHFARVVHSFSLVYCHVDRNWVNKTMPCPLDPSTAKSYSMFFHRVLKKSAHKDGTLYTGTIEPFTMGVGNEVDDGKVQYEVHKYSFKNRENTNTKIWQWVADRQSKKPGVGKFLEAWYSASPNMTIVEHRGTCSKECPLGSIRDYDRNSLKSKCCWSCQACPKNHRVMNNTCQPCKQAEVVGPRYGTCLLMQERMISWREPIVLCFIVLSILGICLTVFVALVFCRYNDNRIVRAAGRDLSYMILLGICFTFSCCFVFIWETTQSTCILRGGLPGFSFLTCYAPLFLKTIRIYRIFVGAQVSVSRPALVSTQSQFIALFVILSTQLLISVVWFVSKIPTPEIIVTGEYVTSHCSGDASPILLFLNLSLSVIFMVSCTVLAFKTRHFPKNFNEAKFIGITLYITCVGWAVFLPVYFLAPHLHRDFMKELLMCAVCTFIGYVTLFGLFGHKMKLLLFGPLPPARQGSIPTWYIPREHSKSLSSTYSCECKMYSPKSCCEELNGFSSL
ncbi:metabotropic glutamate receptor 3-like [Clytia hemisphaerica]|uniref:G-protein coupled receptors family 3 profile domain-containing protein n=1 Tax=Clytia hemisphaerica TaxID=252671 RepID=A0A7M5XAT4_9CNID